MTEEKNNKSSGGMYRGVNVSVKVLDVVIGIGILVITFLTFMGKA